MKKSLLVLLFVGLLSNVAMASTTYTFKKSDTLWSLCQKYYSNQTLHLVLAEINGIRNPRSIKDGILIIIPSKDEIERIANEKDEYMRKRLISQIDGIDKVTTKEKYEAKKVIVPVENPFDEEVELASESKKK